MVGHLDAVGLHGVARAIVEVAHVRVVEVGNALLDHLGRVPLRRVKRRGLRFVRGAPLRLRRLPGLARRRQRGAARPGAILAAGRPGSAKRLTALESSFERRLFAKRPPAAAAWSGASLAQMRTLAPRRGASSGFSRAGCLLVCYRTL